MAMDDVVRFIYWSGEAWWDRVHDDAATPVDPGSPLDDPELLPGDAPIGQLVWRLIADGGSHMAAHHKWMVATDGGIWLKPSTTLGRTAAICAARAVYVLAGSTRAERRVRALQLMNDEAAGLISHTVDMVKRGDEGAEALAEEAEAYRDEVGDLLEEAGMKRGSKKTDTDLLSDAAEHFDPGRRSEARRQIEMMWRLGSATAHGRSFTWDTGHEDRSHEEQLVAAWSIPAQLLEIAWDQWCRLRFRQ
ncbi:hypothetical protein [Brachybacterium vulturis]|uniref:hypothetical protein n=1 Tax=Brachybacterium vulturis TaxID=2017484 RepID=UPI0012FD590A|nr:hypothetical protein [Brachybacterium vulturis]